jgi:hypothetical protein
LALIWVPGKWFQTTVLGDKFLTGKADKMAPMDDFGPLGGPEKSNWVSIPIIYFWVGPWEV